MNPFRKVNHLVGIVSLSLLVALTAIAQYPSPKTQPKVSKASKKKAAAADNVSSPVVPTLQNGPSDFIDRNMMVLINSMPVNSQGCIPLTSLASNGPVRSTPPQAVAEVYNPYMTVVMHPHKIIQYQINTPSLSKLVRFLNEAKIGLNSDRYSAFQPLYGDKLQGILGWSGAIESYSVEAKATIVDIRVSPILDMQADSAWIMERYKISNNRIIYLGMVDRFDPRSRLVSGF